MPLSALGSLLTGPWALVLMSILVFGDAFFVVIPGELAVSALGAASSATGTPPLPAVIACAAIAAFCGDLACYGIGRTVGTQRWAWLRRPRARAALESARRRLDTGAATVLFTARFIPFARLAVNLTAGASRLPLSRYALLALIAATGWASYQAAAGAVIALIVPGGPVVAILCSVLVAIIAGAGLDLLIARIRRRSVR